MILQTNNNDHSELITVFMQFLFYQVQIYTFLVSRAKV